MVTGIGAGIVQQVFWFVENQAVLSALSVAAENGSAQSLIPFQPMLSSYFSGLTDLSLLQPSDFTLLNDMYLNMHLTVGASGAVFGILLAFAMLYPNTPLYLMFIPIPIKAKYFVVFYGLVELFMGVANFSGDNVAHFAHLGGILFGFILVKFWKKKDRDNGRYFY
jgi:membrane associated rhomboid family serine protease